MLYNGNMKGREWMKHMNNMFTVLLVIAMLLCGCAKDTTVYNEQAPLTSQDLTEQTTIHTTTETPESETASQTTASEADTTSKTTIEESTPPQTTPTTDKVENTPTKEENDMRVIGYLTTWNYGCYKTLDWDNLTHINIAFVNPNESGVFNNDIGSDSTLKDIVKTAHKNGVKVLASLGGWGGSVNYPKLIETDEGIEELNQNLLKFVEKFDLDGIDIDVEGDVDKSLWTRYDAWMTELRKMCDENELLFTTACAKWYAHNISDYALSLFDFVNVMVYDNTSEKNHASMEYAKDQLNYFVKRGVNERDLVIGVPFYARDPNFAYMAYKNIIKADETAYTKDYYGEYSYNGKDMMEAKCELSKSYGGIMIWELGDDAPAPFSLLDVIGNNVLG